MEYLGFGITCDGIKPINNKIEAITNMKTPNNQKQVWKFIGVINYYRDTWKIRPHTLSPLTILMSITRKFKWTQVKEKSSEEIKWILACNTLLNYKDYNKIFKIHTDASAFQLGADICQKGKPIAIISINLTDAQLQYTVTERELLRTVKNLKNFRTILLFQKLRIYNHHKNLTCKNFNTNRVLIWRQIFEEYVPDIEYNKGDTIVVAGAISILPLNVNE